MEVGIFTFHRAHNYGAMLQTYALKKACESLGSDVSVIDYAPAYIDAQYRYFKPKKNLRGNALNARNVIGNFKKAKRFEAFKNDFFNLAPFASDKSFDVLLYGSDQIWNPNIKSGFDEVFFGVHNVKAKKHIAYAASIGKSSFTDEELKAFAKLAKNLDGVSVREETAKKILQPACNAEIKVTLDPTLLLDSREWSKITVPISAKKPYILVYEVTKIPQTMQIAERLSQKTGLPIVEITYNKTKLKYDRKVLNNLGPREFVSYIAQAEYVVTSSFHGTAFSLIFEKNFYTVSHRAYGSRMNDLLFKLGISDRLVEALPDALRGICYGEVSKKLKEEKEKSIYFLKNAIGNRGDKI